MEDFEGERKSQKIETAMEEPREAHSEENKVSSEKTKKRQLKTPAQVTALEEFYNANKYPSEELKSELAIRIGLTDKQVSGWFCHRRLKDKRLSRDEGVLHDPVIGGLKQDSCGSTKQGDYRHVDLREVESPRFNGQHVPASENAFELRSHYTGNFSADDTSSESSSPLRESLNSRRVDPYDMGTSRHLMQHGVALPNNAKGAKNTGYKPSGYLKVKGVIENVAITAVKRQLGRNYREDGPPLGVAFQPLPPGAFELSDHEPCDVRDQPLLCSPDTSAPRKQPRLGTRYGVPDFQIGSQELHIGGTNETNMHGSDSHDNISQHRLKHKSVVLGLPNAAPVPPVYDSKKKDRVTSKHGVDKMKSPSISHPPPRPYGAKVARERTEAWLQESDYVSTKVIVPTHNKSLDTEERPHVEKRARKEYHEPVRGKIHPTNELGVPKRSRDESELEKFATKTHFPELPHQTNQTKGLALEMPSSFSEDETAETSSSLG